MPPTLEQHVTFWRTVAQDLDDGRPLTAALAHAGKRVQESELQAIAGVLIEDIRGDVIMVGELRDLETVHVSVQCSLTGHLLMTTMHSNTSPGALRRLLDVGLEPFLVNSTVAGVISQRLVRVLCPECRREAEPPLDSIPPAAVDFISRLEEPAFYVPGDGPCECCHGTGFHGRVGIHEILVADDGDEVGDEVEGQQRVAHGEPEQQLRQPRGCGGPPGRGGRAAALA